MRLRRCMFRLSVFLFAAAISLSAQTPGTAKVNVQYEDSVRNANYPELVYWFVTPETLSQQRYSADIQHIARDTEFTFPFLTARNGVDFLISPEAHDAVVSTVKQAHRNGLRIGVSLVLGDGGVAKSSIPGEEQTVVADGEGTLEAEANTTVEAAVKLRFLEPVKTKLLRACVFRKTGPGEYNPATLADMTDRASTASLQPGALSVSLSLGPLYAG